MVRGLDVWADSLSASRCLSTTWWRKKTRCLLISQGNSVSNHVERTLRFVRHISSNLFHVIIVVHFVVLSSKIPIRKGNGSGCGDRVCLYNFGLTNFFPRSRRNEMVDHKHVVQNVEGVRGTDINGNLVVLTKTHPEQLVLFQTFLSDEDDHRHSDEKYSNTIELYDAVPKYFSNPRLMERMRKEGKYLPMLVTPL